MCVFQHLWRKESILLTQVCFQSTSLSKQVCSAFASVAFRGRYFILPIWATWIEQNTIVMQNVWCFLVNRQGKHLLIINRVDLPGEQETRKTTVSPQAAIHLFALWLAVFFSTVCQSWNRTISSMNLVTSPVKWRVKIIILFRHHRRYNITKTWESKYLCG